MGFWKSVYTDKSTDMPKGLIDGVKKAEKDEEAALRAFMKRYYPGRKASLQEMRDLRFAWQEQADFEKKMAQGE